MGRGQENPGVRRSVIVLLCVVFFAASSSESVLRGRGGASAANVIRRRRSSVDYHHQQQQQQQHQEPLMLWRKLRAMNPNTMSDQRTMLMRLLLDGGGTSNNQPPQSRQWSNTDRSSLIFLNRNDPLPTESQSIESNLPDGRGNWENFENIPPRQISAFYDTPQYFRNLGRPKRRHQNPEFRSSYLALDENLYTPLRDAPENQLWSLGARKIISEPKEGGEWRRTPTQRFWRSLRSLNERRRPGDYVMSSKRQPPPGFHAIRGKRDSDSGEEEEEEEDDEEEGEEEEEEEKKEQEEEEEGRQEAINRWMRLMSGRIRHDMS